MTSWPFLVRFVLWSAAAFGLWQAFLANWYIAVIVAVGPHLSHLFGYAASVEDHGRAAKAIFAYGNGRVGIQVETATLGVLPFVALVGSTTWRTIPQRLWLAALGIATCFVFHVLLFLAYPFFLNHSGLVADSLGAFWAILIYCGFPFLLWLVLLSATRPEPAPASERATEKDRAASSASAAKRRRKGQPPR